LLIPKDYPNKGSLRNLSHNNGNRLFLPSPASPLEVDRICRKCFE
jgi:hypothetical protein